MKTIKQLVLIFNDEIGEKFTIRINDPKTSLDEATVIATMNEIIQLNIFESKGFNLETAESAYIREVVITEYL